MDITFRETQNLTVGVKKDLIGDTEDQRSSLSILNKINSEGEHELVKRDNTVKLLKTLAEAQDGETPELQYKPDDKRTSANSQDFKRNLNQAILHEVEHSVHHDVFLTGRLKIPQKLPVPALTHECLDCTLVDLTTDGAHSSYISGIGPPAALGGCNWPPYLLVVWVFILVLSHALYSLLTVLHQLLPHVHQLSQFLRVWTQECWLDERQKHHKLMTALLAISTITMYNVYFAMYALHVVVAWLLEPLSADKKRPEGEETNYEDLKAT